MESVYEICNEFLETKRHLAESTQVNYRSTMKKILKYLAKNNISSLSEVTRDTVIEFTLSLSQYKAATANAELGKLSALLKYAFEQGYIEKDISRYCLKVFYYSDSKIPDTFTPQEINRAIAEIDISTGLGKRNYATMMLSSRLGIRGSDIVKLKFSNLRFDTDTIEISQSKTSKRLILPMSEEVGMALINYLRTGRPKSDSDIIFLRHREPYTPLKQVNKETIANYAKSAKIDNNRTLGVRSLRHSLASALLAKDNSIYNIKDVLGHESIDTTMRYIKIDQQRLLQCALEVPPLFTS